ncbi:MAG: tRNA dihydrouridine synthase DusB [Acholeplasmataceae bacterium]|jgi:nifR3 family TIM-barrel protein|nr:tRNA dihydrouridine synthase DusB [Acholeplasmataceae bacterium]
MRIKNVEIPNRIVLAPMAGYTNRSFRMIMKEFGAGLVYTEMISAQGLLYNNEKTLEMTKVAPTEHPLATQLFGGDISAVAAAAAYLDKNTAADIIDINMGCPVRKVLKAESGCRLLTDPEKVYKMVQAVVDNVQKPVSVKIRAGWDHNSVNAQEIAQAIEKAGASLIAIHGRTKTDLYGGKVNLDYIKAVKDSVNIPVIGNGDIRSIEDAERMFAHTGVDMIMIGRGSLGNPWLIRDLVDHFSGRTVQAPPTPKEKIGLCKKHFAYLLEEKGEKIAVLEMRSLAAWYVRGIEHNRDFKQRLINITKKEELDELLERFLNENL